MLWLSFALSYLALSAVCLSQPRHHQRLLHVVVSRWRQHLLRSLAGMLMMLALGCCAAARGLEMGLVVWLCQLLLAGVVLVLLLAWRSGWVLPLAAGLPLFAALLVL